MSGIPEDYSVVSSKNDALLLRSKTDSLTYRIQFKIATTNDATVDPRRYIGFDMYNDFERINGDVIENIVMEDIPEEPNTRFMMMQFKPIGASFGIKGKYMITKVNKICPIDKMCVGLIGTPATIEQTSFTPAPNYEEIICKNSQMFAFWDSSSKSMIFQYDFSLFDPTFQKHGMQVPRSVSDMSALLIKKIFIRMKEFKEKQIQIDNANLMEVTDAQLNSISI